jgi:hypothetical protein
VAALEEGSHPLGVRVEMKKVLRQRLVSDGTADRLDAVLCAVAAAWAVGQPNYGMPIVMDPVEGWTAGAAHGEAAY